MRRFCFYKRGPIWYAKLYNPANGPIIDQTFIDAMAGGDGTSSSLRQPFDFLGYTCGPCYAAKSSAVYLGAKPSKRRIKRLYGKIREQLNRGNNDPSQDVVAAVNRILVGWSQYFSYGTSVPNRGLSYTESSTVVALSQAQGERKGNTTVPRNQTSQQLWACLSVHTSGSQTLENLR